jgi:4-hydroxy-tetrahydrodipicolinate reductase
MGRLLVEAIEQAPDLHLAARVDVRGPADAPHGAVSSSLFAFAGGGIDVACEFTRGDAPARIGPEIEKLGCAWLSGTTALTDASRSALESAAKNVPVLWSPNMSLGAALMTRLVEEAARTLPEGWELEIVETHHAAKLDAPSGTAVLLAEAWRRLRGGEVVHGRSGFPGPRPPKEVGIHAVRLPGSVGEHRLLIGAQAESLELIHRASDRSVFAAGALIALRWLAGKPAGLYTLRDWVGERLG